MASFCCWNVPGAAPLLIGGDYSSLNPACHGASPGCRCGTLGQSTRRNKIGTILHSRGCPAWIFVRCNVDWTFTECGIGFDPSVPVFHREIIGLMGVCSPTN